jgi:hypothetical protein
MGKRASISLAELPPEVRAQLKNQIPRKPRVSQFSMNEVRTAAIRVLAVVADLTPSQRARVLKHAARVNDL